MSDSAPEPSPNTPEHTEPEHTETTPVMIPENHNFARESPGPGRLGRIKPLRKQLKLLLMMFGNPIVHDEIHTDVIAT